MFLTERHRGLRLQEQHERLLKNLTLRAGRMSESNQQQNLVLIKELELILDSCKLELTSVDEVWPNLYLGNV